MAEENKNLQSDFVEKTGLNPKQELFCELYASSEEFFGNGVQCYIEVYEPDQTKPNWYKTACAASSRMLSNVKICKRINELLEEGGLNEAYVDKQLLFLVTQHEDKSAKLGAIKEFNSLKGRVIKKIEHGGKVNYSFNTNVDV